MPTEIDEASTGGNDLLFAKELEGTVIRPLETGIYDADEVQEITGDDSPEHGRWLPCATRDKTVWVQAVGELIEELQRIDGDLTETSLRVTRCEKSGSKQTDPFEVNLSADGDDTTIEARPEGYWKQFS